MPARDQFGRPRLRIVRPDDGGGSGQGGGSGANEERLRQAAIRAAAHPFYMSSVLKEYQGMEGEDDSALAARLGTTPDRLWKLGLCRAPDVDSASFRNDLQRIAAHAEVFPSALLSIVRAVSSVRAFRDAPASYEALLAARDRVPDPESDEETDDPDGEAP